MPLPIPIMSNGTLLSLLVLKLGTGLRTFAIPKRCSPTEFCLSAFVSVFHYSYAAGEAAISTSFVLRVPPWSMTTNPSIATKSSGIPISALKLPGKLGIARSSRLLPLALTE